MWHMTVERTVRLRFDQRSRAGRHPHQPVRGAHRRAGAVGRGRRNRHGGAPGRRRRGHPAEYAGQTTFRLADLVPCPGRRGRGGRHRRPRPQRALPVGGRLAQPAPQADQGPPRRRQGAEAAGQGRRARPTARSWYASRSSTCDGLPTLVRELVVDGVRAARRGRSPADGNLRELLRDDAHLAPFLPIPGKDNGLDIEGIAVAGGPGLPRPARTGPARLGLRPGAAPVRRPGRPGAVAAARRSTTVRPYRKHVLRPGRAGRPRPVPGRRRPAGPGRADDEPGRPGAGLPLARRRPGRDAADRARRRC